MVGFVGVISMAELEINEMVVLAELLQPAGLVTVTVNSVVCVGVATTFGPFETFKSCALSHEYS